MPKTSTFLDSSYRNSIVIGLCCVSVLATNPSVAQDTQPPCSEPQYNHFDFWLGNWNVYTPQGELAGSNTISKVEGNCLILEQWLSSRGTTGQSYNYFNPATQKWHQLWISPGSIIEYSGGLTDTGAMNLHGTISYHSGATNVPFRGTWTAQPDGSVLQEFVQFDEPTDTWQSWFTGIYKRSSASQSSQARSGEKQGD